MKYQSTRGKIAGLTSAEVIAHGLSDDGGLFVPESFPRISLDTVMRLVSMPYNKRAAYIMSLFLSDFSIDELEEYSCAAYSVDKSNGHGTDNKAGRFTDERIAPLHKINCNTHFLELWHGPTCAFKDMALQVTPRLLTASLKKIGEKRDVCILVATSGDTGKAALDGFRDIQGTKIMIFYPHDGVSKVQKLQMITQEGSNVNVVAVDGNFDDTQTGVKQIFSDKSLRTKLSDFGYILSSANSINWGRLVPQVAYYISSYCDLINSGEIKPGDKINFCVPTGNFGNILAAYYAERMGLPINKLICASNRNDVLTQFIDTGVYNKNRPFYTTASPSMDILISSNLERLLYELSDKDGDAVSSYMAALSNNGFYSVSDTVQAELGRVFASGKCSEEDTMKTIGDVFGKYDYLIDTHTAVAYKVLDDYRLMSGDETISVIVSTASPFKFCEAVLDALGHEHLDSGTALIDTLAGVTGCPVPKSLMELKSKTPRFDRSVAKNDMKGSVISFVKS
ncbi:MAG: threonine synthase [Oscillospiraceae bacterium]|jgi:threonine synthase|nr:threonine synthase [Oscillospiraceae bacterium]